MSSHNLAEVEKVCDRVGFIRSGKLIEVSSVRELRKAATKEYRITFATAPDPAHFKSFSSVRDVTIEGKELTCSVKGRLNELVRVLGKYDVINIRKPRA
jgi:ABC-2 type transport system ATP-binding protein